jgi:stage V sporulation protein R
MELLKNEQKRIMEECKRIALDNGLRFRDETLEFIVTNEDMIKLSPKAMIPTLYDYWVHDVFVLQDKGKYEVYPHNPYETVINTRPPLSFYNDNNPEWLNVMIFYHVIAHIDFFQNNVYFEKTWLDDFLGKALADGHMIKELRLEKGRWVDYVIEFARGMDNLVNYYTHLSRSSVKKPTTPEEEKFQFFFQEYLQTIIKADTFRYIDELEKYNTLAKEHPEKTAKTLFLIAVNKKYLDFNLKFERRSKENRPIATDLMEYVIYHSPKMNKLENEWMKSVVQVVRDTSLYFQPQIRTKILNEGWASYWHEVLFMADPRLRSHEIEFSKINAGVVSLPRVGMNPYAIGLRLFKYLEAKSDRGMLSFDFEKIQNIDQRRSYDQDTKTGRDFIFQVRAFHSDFTALSEYIDQDFCDEFKLFVTARRVNQQRQTWEYYIKSRKAKDFQKQMFDGLYHPPHITVDRARTEETGTLHLVHHFEGKELVREYITNTMLGIEFLWGTKVILETHEVDESKLQREDHENYAASPQEAAPVQLTFQKVVYTMEDKKLSRQVVQ